jgi:hypothetical protein
MNYPVNCKKCGQLLFGTVKYCPFCGVQALKEPVPVIEDKPRVVEEKAPVTEVKPQIVEQKPPEAEIKIPVVEEKSAVTEVKPQEVEEKPQMPSEKFWPDEDNNSTPTKPPVLIYVSVVAAIIIGIIFVKTFFNDNGSKPLEPAKISQPVQPIQTPVDEQRVATPPINQPKIQDVLPNQQNQKVINDLINKGLEYYQQGQYKLSIESMNEVLRLDGNNQVARNNIEMSRRAEQEISDDINSGIEYYNKGQYQLTIEKMKEVIRRNAGNQIAKDFIEKAKKRQRMVDSSFVNLETGVSR